MSEGSNSDDNREKSQSYREEEDSKPVLDKKPNLRDMDNETKPAVDEAEEEDNKITIGVTRGNNDTTTHFKVRENTPFKRIFARYCDKFHMNMSEVRFFFDGVQLSPDQTPKELKMSNNDQIEVMRSQIGGC